MLSIQQFKNWGGVQKEHKQFHSNYSSLEHRIRVHLGIYRKARIIGKDYVEMISSEFDNLEASSPNIPEVFQKMYMNLLAKDGNDMTHSSLFEKIKIKTEDSNPSSSSSTSSSVIEDDVDDVYDWGTDEDKDKKYKKDVEIVKMREIEVQNDTPNILIDNEPFSVVVDTPKEVNHDTPKEINHDTLKPKERVIRNPSIENINIESPFETDDRYKYEVTRFLTNKN